MYIVKPTKKNGDEHGRKGTHIQANGWPQPKFFCAGKIGRLVTGEYGIGREDTPSKFIQIQDAKTSKLWMMLFFPGKTPFCFVVSWTFSRVESVKGLAASATSSRRSISRFGMVKTQVLSISAK